jgi:hypothetical protein
MVEIDRTTFWPRRDTTFSAQAQVTAWVRGVEHARRAEQAVGRLLSCWAKRSERTVTLFLYVLLFSEAYFDELC